MHGPSPVSLERLQQGLLIVGIVALLNSLWMVWAFGAAMSTKHAIALVAVDIIGAVAFVVRGFMAQAGATGAARLAGAVACVGIGIAFFSHLGYTIGMRTESVQEATLQQSAYKMRADGVDENRELNKVMVAQLADLRERNGWAAATTAEALRAEVDGMKLDIEQETARGGCKSKCLKKVKALDGVEKQIATMEKMDDLQGRIEATQRAIADASEKTIATEVKASPVKAQTEFLAQIYNAASGADAETILNPDAVQMSLTGILVGFLIALASTGSPPALLWMAFWSPIQKQNDEAAAAAAAATASGNNTNTRVTTRTVTNTVPGSFQRTDALGRRQTVTITPNAVAA